MSMKTSSIRRVQLEDGLVTFERVYVDTSNLSAQDCQEIAALFESSNPDARRRRIEASLRRWRRSKNPYVALYTAAIRESLARSRTLPIDDERLFDVLNEAERRVIDLKKVLKFRPIAQGAVNLVRGQSAGGKARASLYAPLRAPILAKFRALKAERPGAKLGELISLTHRAVQAHFSARDRPSIPNLPADSNSAEGIALAAAVREVPSDQVKSITRATVARWVNEAERAVGETANQGQDLATETPAVQAVQGVQAAF